MPLLFVLGPIFGVAVLVACVAHAHKATVAASVQAPRQFELDHGMPDDVVQRVLGDLLHEDDPAKLEALAHEIAAQYPLASRELQVKADASRARTAAASAPPYAHSPAPSHSAIAASPDMGEPAVILQAAMKALTQENDPVELEGFAESIRAKYPTAAILLLGRAHELRAAAAANAPVPPPNAPASPARGPSTNGEHTATTTSRTYVVQSGDSPGSIAHRLAHDGNRWPELVAANPDKPRGKDGSFESLRAGEILLVPLSWSAGPNAHAPAAAHPKEVHA